MIEVHPEPVVDVVALLALGWELGRQVIRRVGLLIRLLVTRITLRRESLELPDRSALVAVRTIQPRMPPNEWETVFVFPNSLQNNVPPFDRMALFAIGAHLSPVNVGVAVCAIRAHVGEHRLGMALRASHSLVQAAQRVLGLIMVELGDRANRLPAHRGVAVLAGDVQVAVGAPRNRARFLSEARQAETNHPYGGQSQQQPSNAFCAQPEHSLAYLVSKREAR